MAKFEVKIRADSPIHLGSGQADVNIDSDVIHDKFGLPYFPAKRFKGLLYESAVEVQEMFELAGMKFDAAVIDEIFHHDSGDDGKISNTQLIVPNFYIKPYDEYKKICDEWAYLQEKYRETFRPADVLDAYTTVRYQTRLENGIAADSSLRNLRVLNAGVEFFGELELLNGNDKHLKITALAIRNLSSAGAKRNRGFRRITCTMKKSDKLIDDALKGGI